MFRSVGTATADTLRQWKETYAAKLRLGPVLTGVVTILVVGMLTVFGMWIYMTYQTYVQVSVLLLRFDSYIKEQEAKEKALRSELDGIYQTLYAAPDDPTPAAAPRKPTAVEVWQVNRDKELRARILRLEQWRMKEGR